MHVFCGRFLNLFLLAWITAQVPSPGQTPAGAAAQPSSPAPQAPKISLSDVRRLQNVIFQQISGGETWTKFVGKSVVLYYTPLDSLKDPAATVALFDASAAADCQALKLDLPTNPIPIYLYPNLGELTHALGIRQGFEGGLSLGPWGAIINPSGDRKDQLGAIAAHVIGQALVHENLGDFGCPLFAEGIAFYLQARYRNSGWLQAPAPFESKTLTELADTASKEDDYLEGARFIAYLVSLDKGDPTRLKALMSALNRERVDMLREIGQGTWAKRVDRVFRKIYGEGLDTLDTKWRATSSF